MGATMLRTMIEPQSILRGEAFIQDLAETLPTCLRENLPWLVASEPVGSECLSEDEVLDFTSGQLAGEHVRRIDEHLGECHVCSRLVTEMLGELAERSSTHAVLVPCVFAPSTLVGGRFEIERLIGRGGMGEVYEARDTQRGRTVALKTVLAARCDSPRAMARLSGELHATLALEHPNVCRAHGMGVHVESEPNGVSCRFIVMEYIEGETLGQRTRREGAPPLGEALSIARQLLLALHAIHRAGIVHLDVKSDNVMLRAGAEPHAVLIDFGLARPTLSNLHTPTRHQSPLGAALYMAPEQLARHPVGPHTDVFGFGVVLYELLTGVHPFQVHQASSLEARTLRENELPLRPSRALDSISEPLDELVAGCTQPDPSSRISDAAAALRYLDAFVS
jgi:serine/threonine-protein kinase